MERSAAHDDLLDAFALPGCPVCRLTHQAVEHAMDSIDYEFVNDPGFRADVDAAWGFCPEHASQWLARARILSTSLVYDDVLKEIEAALRQLEPSQRGGRMLDLFARFNFPSDASSDRECTLLKPEGRCPFCRVRDEAAALAVTALIAGLSEPDFQAAYSQSATLCIPHLRQALCRAAPEEFAILREVAIAHVEQLRRHLREIIRKHDYRYRHEPAGIERGAAQRAVYHVAGWPGATGHARQVQ